MKIGLAFWGLTRSLKYTIKSIEKHILNVLNNNKIEFDIYIHTYQVNSIYNNPRAREKNIKLDNTEYKLLKPKYFKIDDQDKIKKKLKLLEYRTNPDPWKTNYVTVDNFICAMYSKMEVIKLVKNSRIKYDYIIFLRPDVLYLNDFDINIFIKINNKNICIPNFHLYSNFNDRFFIGTYKNAMIYGFLFKDLLKYSKYKRLHSETFNYVFMHDINKLNIIYIKFYFNRIRADGREVKDCKKL